MSRALFFNSVTGKKKDVTGKISKNVTGTTGRVSRAFKDFLKYVTGILKIVTGNLSFRICTFARNCDEEREIANIFERLCNH